MEKINKDDFLNNVQGIINEMKSQVDAYASQVFEDNMAAKKEEKALYCLENIINKNGINLKESIKNIVNSEASDNVKLMETIEQYAGALNQGLYEERLYESFLQNISKFDYLLPVEAEIKRINESVDKNSKPIEITKILEEMTTTQSYYLVPMIEEDACRFVKDPSDTNRVQLRNILCPFASDPYCNHLLNILETKDDVHVKSLSEKAMSINDKIKFVREDAAVKQIYSPVQYIKENESVFNANGQFYVKKGNTLAKLSEEYVNQLSDKFLTMCQLVNDPHVTIFDDHIILTGNDKVASIYEDHIDINGNPETKESLRNINEMCIKYDFDNNFFIMASCLCENFDNIAIINFGKHIELNRDNGVNIDMFRIGNNIYVNAVNENLMISTFYQNVNPIQCRNLINKHMGINVASLFEDLIPSQEKILVKLNETQDQYKASIEKLEKKLGELKDTKEDCTSEDNIKELDKVIKSTESKLKELKDEYKEWQKKTKEATEVPEAEDTSEKKEDTEKTDDAEKADSTEKTDDAEKTDDDENNDDTNTEVEKSNEPIDASEVEAAKTELTQRLGDNVDNVDNNDTITNDVFSQYLNNNEGNDNPDNFAEEVPAENVDTTETPAEEPISDTENTSAENTNDNATETSDNTAAETPDEGFTEMSNDNNAATEEPVENNVANDDNTAETPEEDDIIDFDQMEHDFNQSDEDVAGNETTNDIASDNYVTPELQAEGYKIANITFDQNVKSGEFFKTGTIMVITPMIDGTGKMFAQSNTYDFYIDENTHHPVINTPGVPVALYNAMYNAVLTDPGFEKADKEGASMVDYDASKDPDNKDIWYDANQVEKTSEEIEKNDDNDFFNITDNNDTFKVEPKDNETPAQVNNEVSLEDDKVLADIFNGYDKDQYKENESPAAEAAPENVPENTPAEEQIPAVDEIPAETKEETSEIPAVDEIPTETKEETSEIPAVDEIPAADEVTPKEQATDAVPTYKAGETEIELPAATADNTNIPEITPAEAENPNLIDNGEKDSIDNVDQLLTDDNITDSTPADIDFDKELNANTEGTIDFDAELDNLNSTSDENDDEKQKEAEDFDAELEEAIAELDKRCDNVNINEAHTAINKLRKEMKNRDQIISIHESKVNRR